MPFSIDVKILVVGSETLGLYVLYSRKLSRMTFGLDSGFVVGVISIDSVYYRALKLRIGRKGHLFSFLTHSCLSISAYTLFKEVILVFKTNPLHKRERI